MFRVLPEPASRSVKIITKPGYPAPLPDVAGLEFQPLDFTGPAEARQSRRWDRAMRRVEITPIDNGLRCDLASDPDDERSPYSGVSFAVPGMQALRFDLELTNPEDISSVYVYVYGARKGQFIKWHWKLSRLQRQQGFSGPVVLVPNQPSDYFRIESELAADQIREVHVFIRIKRGAQAGFILRGVESGAAPASADYRHGIPPPGVCIFVSEDKPVPADLIAGPVFTPTITEECRAPGEVIAEAARAAVAPRSDE